MQGQTKDKNVSTVRLVSPTPSMEDAYLDFIAEWEKAGEEIVPVCARMVQGGYAAWLKEIKLLERGAMGKKNWLVPEHYVVPSNLYFMVDDEQNIIGAADIRHYLNAYLISYGGQIGYGVRPLRRGEGYGRLLFDLALEKAADLGLKRILLTCYKSNPIVSHIIVSDGGILDREVSKGNEIVQQYWIETAPFYKKSAQ